MDPAKLAQLWGKNRNIPGMTYDNLSRSLRYYYKTNKMKKVPGKKQVYQFIFSEQNPPQIDPQLGSFIERSHQMEKEILFRQGLELITPMASKSQITPNKRKKQNQDVKPVDNAIEASIGTDHSIDTEISYLESGIDIKEEPPHSI